MGDTARAPFPALVETLTGDLDDLEGNLTALLAAASPSSASKLPLLDQAKLHVLTAYAIESLLFSYLRIHGVDAKDHSVFKELSRVKQYFAKISKAENPVEPQGPNIRVDKAAAGRIIKHGLGNNNRGDLG